MDTVSISEMQTFEQQIKEMSKPQLIQMAGEKYGLTVDDKLTEETIRGELVRQEEAKKGQAKTLNEESALEFQKRGEKITKCVFHRFDFPEADLEFNRDGGYGIKGEINKTGFAKCPSFRFFPGETYLVPVCIKNQLESLTYQTTKTIRDGSGNEKSVSVLKPKFMFIPVMSDAELPSYKL